MFVTTKLLEFKILNFTKMFRISYIYVRLRPNHFKANQYSLNLTHTFCKTTKFSYIATMWLSLKTR